MSLLTDLLTVTEIDRDNFETAPSAERHVRAFGGRTVAQATMAAIATVDPSRPIHSLHSYFMLPGDSSKPMECQVFRLRDGQSFSVRQVHARQRGELIFAMMASFHRGEAGPEHNAEMPNVAGPDELPTFTERYGNRNSEDDMQRWFYRVEPFDVRYVSTSPFELPTVGHPAHQQVWLRALDLPDDPAVQAGALTYASDMTILDPVLLRHGIQWTDRAILGATLDHSIWFHSPVNFSDWLLFDETSSVAGSGRVLATANIWSQNGTLVATVQQEALMRPV